MGFLEDAKKLQEEEKENRIETKSNMELLNELDQMNNIRDKRLKQEEFIQ